MSQCEGLFVGEHVLAERGAEHGEPFYDRGEPLLRRIVKRGARTAETRMVTLGDALLLGIKPKRVGLAHHGIDSAKQCGIGMNPMPVPRDLRRDVPLEFKERVVGMRAGQDLKRIVGAIERPPAEFKSGDRIVEIRR